jgi:hypothetical protein
VGCPNSHISARSLHRSYCSAQSAADSWIIAHTGAKCADLSFFSPGWRVLTRYANQALSVPLWHTVVAMSWSKSRLAMSSERSNGAFRMSPVATCRASPSTPQTVQRSGGGTPCTFGPVGIPRSTAFQTIVSTALTSVVVVMRCAIEVDECTSWVVIEL